MTSAEAPVLPQDQLNINKFSCLNLRVKNYETTAAALREFDQQLKDASEELSLKMTPDPVLLRFGECFVVEEDEDLIQSHLDDLSAKNTKKSLKNAKDIELTQELMNALKAQLYGKFGNRINLDV